MKVLIIIGLIVLLIGSIFLLELGGLSWTKFFASRRENVRREVFLNTRSYNEGKLQDLIKYRLEYMRAQEEDREAIASAIRMSFADFDSNKLPTELKDFLDTVMY